MDFFKNTLILAASSIFFIGCGDESIEAPTTNAATVIAEATVEKVTYKAAIISNFEPYAFRGDERKLVGFNIDITDAVAVAEGFNVQYLEKQPAHVLNSVVKGKVDFIGSIITITPERDEIIDYSDSYMTSSIDAFVKPELKGYSFQQLLEDESLKYGVVKGSRFADYALSIGIGENMLTTSRSNIASVSNVFSGKVDVVLTDRQNIKYLKKQYPDINIINNPNYTAEYAYVVQTGNADMQQVLNSGIAKVKENGQYNKIYDKWFGE